MSEQTARLALPIILPAQAQKHVTHNEALEKLDLVVQLALEAFDALTPPANPQDGHIWALGATPSGVWAGQAGRLAAYIRDQWEFVTPAAGWIGCAGSTLRVFDGAEWVAPQLDGLQNLPGLGLNTSFDATNRLAVAADATLLSHEGAGHQLKINKAAATDTASLLFQTDWSGRAEMGTTGNDDFTIKVSANGSDWHDALVADGVTGALSAPNGLDADMLALDGSQVYAQSNILGTVSQSDGSPTGAIIQRGSNANGEFVRYADGTQICWHTALIHDVNFTIAVGPLFRTPNSGILSWTFPAVFSGSAVVFPASVKNVASNLPQISIEPVTFNATSSTVFVGYSAVSTTMDCRLRMIAIGRWF